MDTRTTDCSGEIELIAAVLRQIRKDLRSRDTIHQRAAQAWLDGAHGSIWEWADIVGMDGRELRARLSE